MKSTTEMDLSKIDVGEIKGIRLIEPNELAEEDEVEMNKKELTKKLMNRMQKFGYFPTFTNVKTFIEEYEKLAKSEPPKPVVPKFVADWIEKCKVIKKFKASLAYALNSEVWSENSLSDECIDWLYNANNQELFARAWLDGYEIEKEKRYLVIMPNVSSSGGVLTRIKHNDSWIWIDTLGTIVEGRTHTRKELEDAGFGWVFDCPGIEVEEVEE